MRELASLLSDFGLDIVAQTDLGVDSAEETGLTFIENAILKARHAAKVTGLTGNCRRLWSGGRCAGWRAGYLLRALFR
ncbi:deoxyribonucleotide triphosphate pyrophosphatase [Escherichia coli]|uniref:Deoxyribonucleotide triphosphate pyrophosphatase n=1 Tax=Escherichia coli TaxID=562 RepID=A0A2X1NAL3_ECOLX|nr:deoxyribonucleotide triphosphate pyrophosphatase [Escherichia coli]